MIKEEFSFTYSVLFGLLRTYTRSRFVCCSQISFKEFTENLSTKPPTDEIELIFLLHTHHSQSALAESIFHHAQDTYIFWGQENKANR